MNDYWNFEVYRLLGAAGLGLIGGLISGHWLLAFLLAASGYIGWMLFKLRQLQRWLLDDHPAETMPDSDGAWEQITYLIHRNHQKNKQRKKKQAELVMRLNNIMSALPDAAILINNDHVIQWANRTAKKLLTISEKSDIGQRIDNLLRTPEIAELIRNKKENKEVRFHAPKDESLQLSARILPVQKGLWLLNVRNITQRLQLQQTRKAFIANASHELRTPLTVMTGYLELFEGEPDIPDYLKPALQQSREQTSRMQQIIDDLLTLSRLENTETKHHQGKNINMPALLDKLIESVMDTLTANTQSIDIDISPDLYIRASEKEVLSVATNLIENAVKYAPKDAHIRVKWRRKRSGHACLSVIDNGAAIPKEHIPHLTERFYRVDSGRSRETGGTGLGLSIVKHVMENHKGYLTIKSRPSENHFQACFPPERVLDSLA